MKIGCVGQKRLFQNRGIPSSESVEAGGNLNVAREKKYESFENFAPLIIWRRLNFREDGK